MTPGTARVGIGGWIFPPWRGTFYPAGLPHAQELPHAASQLTAIEINATFHRTQTRDSFRRWRDAVPDGFVFCLKAPRYATWRSELSEAGPSIERFLDSGITELGDKLGALLWQFPPTRKFDAATLAPFLDVLPASHDGRTLRHAIETPHPSFSDPAVAPLLRDHGVAWAMIEADGYPPAEPTADFLYARLKRNDMAAPEGYAGEALDAWQARLRDWTAQGRDGFVFFIAGDKVRAPDSARAMLKRLAAATSEAPSRRKRSSTRKAPS